MGIAGKSDISTICLFLRRSCFQQRAGIDVMERLLRATINSWNGLRVVFRSEAAFRQELALLVPAVPIALVLTEEPWKRLALIGVLVLLLIVELLNTAIEKLADRVNLEIDPQIGRVKDMGSAAVLLTLLIAGAAWLLALAERIGLL
jgi:diacylglycerol kinase (ATP)